jgi:cation diffusion facilitator CzcD-associated flavoprotein CzcO
VTHENADFHVGIIGAGFGGLVAAMRLQRQGYSFVIFERALELGGTWRDNTYPGCACDVASQLYSFADEPNPDWSQRYSPQGEILAYLKHVAEKRDLIRHIRFGTDVTEARFSPDGTWTVHDRQGGRTRVRFLIMATGPLNRPIMPDLKNASEFEGVYFHSSQWRHDVDLAGKKVAVIGTGASAIQIIPAIAPRVGHLTVVQRTPPWVFFRHDTRTTNFWKHLFRHVPGAQRLVREATFWYYELVGRGFMGNQLIQQILQTLGRWQLRSQIKNVELRKKLSPTFQVGCKRILRSDDYYPVFNRPNVTLVNEPFDRFTPMGWATASGKQFDADLVVFATGFEAAEVNLYLKVYGLEGRDLLEEWQRNSPEVHRGCTVSGYPNLALLLGPNTGLGHNSVVHIMESQMNYVMDYLHHLKVNRAAYFDVELSAQRAYNEKLQRQFRGTVWLSGCKSWYLNDRGRNTTLFPRSNTAFRRQTRKVNLGEYRISTYQRQSNT